MPVGKKQLQRLFRIAAQLKENRYPNRSSLAAEFHRADIDENLNIACSTKTIQRDLKVLRDDFNCPLDFDHEQNGYYLKHHIRNFVEASPLHRRQTLEPYDTRHFMLHIPSMPEHEIIQWILYQAGNAQLLEPAALRKKISRAAAAIAAAHDKPKPKHD